MHLSHRKLFSKIAFTTLALGAITEIVAIGLFRYKKDDQSKDKRRKVRASECNKVKRNIINQGRGNSWRFWYLMERWNGHLSLRSKSNFVVIVVGPFFICTNFCNLQFPNCNGPYAVGPKITQLVYRTNDVRLDFFIIIIIFKFRMEWS